MNEQRLSNARENGRTSAASRKAAQMIRVLPLLLVLAWTATQARAQDKSGDAGGKTAASPQATELEQARRAIDLGNAATVRAWAKGDAGMMAAIFAEDGLELRPDGSVVKGRPQILELIKASMQRLGPGVELTVKTTKVWLDGDTAYETGKSVYKYTEKGEPKTFETLFVSNWKKQKDGTWKLVVDMPVPLD